MYCSNCGHKIEEGAAVCLGCGKFVNRTGNQETYTVASTPKVVEPGKGKSIASLVLGILGVLYALQAFGSIDVGIDYLYYYETVAEKFGFIFGFLLVQSVFATIALCLGISAQKQKKTGLNVAGFWLAISTFALVFLQFILLGINC